MVMDLSYLGIRNVDRVYRNLATATLCEMAIRHREGHLAHLGPLVTRTGQYTGRSANDKFVVREGSSEERVWWGTHNKPMEEEIFERMKLRLQSYLQGRDVYVQDCHCGADPAHRLPVRILTEHAWHSMFVRNMFIREADRHRLCDFEPAFHVVHCPDFKAIPETDGTNSEAFILVNFGQRLVVIGGTAYAGEIKKSVFTVMNYLLPQRGVLSMHCSANRGPDGDVAIFFGLSGTGKTTLSSEADRALIGDDEHGWSDEGVFNFEGGCYAKVIRLSEEDEPEIFQTTRRFGTILENVALDVQTRRIDLDDGTLTENTRASYPITHLPNVVADGMAGHPRNVVLLTADAFGVLPPIARLTPVQARYHFISGYTAKVAGTERGVDEPRATFSACFGAPFMALHPTVYADLLGRKLREHDSRCWLVNTGWTGGPYGTGHRMPIRHTRAMLRAALRGDLDGAEYRRDERFGLEVPLRVPGVPDEVLDPRTTWRDGAAYDEQARELAGRFRENFAEFEAEADPDLAAAGPRPT